MYRKWAQKGKEEAWRVFGGTCRLSSKALSTLIQLHYAARGPPHPCQGRKETEGSCKDSTEIHTKEVQIFCHHPINMSWAYKIFLKSQQEKPYILSYPELSCSFIFDFFNSKIRIILYYRLDTNSGNTDNLLFYDCSINKPLTLHSYLFPALGSYTAE